jgi:hypothetical protein
MEMWIDQNDEQIMLSFVEVQSVDWMQDGPRLSSRIGDIKFAPDLPWRVQYDRLTEADYPDEEKQASDS